MKQWITKACHADLHKIAERYQVSEVFAEILVKRGLHNWQEMDAYLFEELAQETEPGRMWGLEEAAALLFARMQEKHSIRIIGDYDVDGVMSTLILYKGLEQLGGNLSYQIPHREKDGYGIRSYMVEQAAEEGVDTIITCDNGISAVEPVSRAKELGMTVIITDHHEVPVVDGVEQIPPADVVVDPKQERCTYGYRDLCGAGIAYKLMHYMLCRRGMAEKAEELLPFAAMATVCDVVSLQGENRWLVKRGIERIEKTNNLGLQALIQQMEFSREIRAMDIGFRLGPCINAAGRLEDATEGLELFLSGDPQTASERAGYLYQLNESRKEITLRETKAAIQQIEQGELPRILVVYLYLIN
nr:DHH family phosphoesterase [Lachnospiraceae bacterium]